MEKEQVQKYPLRRVQAMIFQNRQEVREFLEVHQDGLDEYRVQTMGPPIVVLFAWKDDEITDREENLMSSSYTECPTCGDMTLAHDDGKKWCLKSDKSDSGFVPEEECTYTIREEDPI